MRENEVGRETRSQRRMRERGDLKKKLQQSKAAPSGRIGRRGLILGTVGLAGVGAVAVLGSELLKKETPQSVIRAEIERLGITRSGSERDLWLRGYQPELAYPIREDQATLDEAGRRYDTAIFLMRASANPIHQLATEFADNLKTNNQLNYQLLVITGGRDVSPLQTTSAFQAGRNHWTIEASAEWLINQLDSVSLTFFQDHEVEHIRNEFKLIEEFVKRNPGATDKQKTDLVQARLLNPDERAAEEARGYGVSAQSFIYHSGLTGSIPGNTKAEHLERAVGFIKAGSGIDRPKWREYIVKHNLA